ncbi:serine hydrolase [Nocardia sp. ET3-3]|uniref:Serine hydrolase n=1 Tax=Nocardia terrae TaxID=2675851 RepID=A0A7K1V6G6_9NOCA|nr:serine hydrolase domain-containing protein [Nocardia terrae]MVU82061.1 serine hydrolase [Nocardia terrae]
MEDEMLRYARGFGCAGVAVVLALCGCGTGGRAEEPAASGYGGTRVVLQRLSGGESAPGVLLEVRDGRGRTVLAEGVAEVGSRVPMEGGDRFRIGSMTKMFVGTVVLQLVGEGRVELDAPVERYLPGVVEGSGNDGHGITVRQLLQHTSGLPDYVQYLDLSELITSPATHHDPEELVRVALAHPPVFAPGTGWQYSNTDYVVAGMLIAKVTGHSYGQEIESRIIRPLGLGDTSVPGDDTAIPGTHSHGYARPGDALVDATEFNPTVADASGAMISSAADMNRFVDALVNGSLLRPSELREMMTTRPATDSTGDAYGLGLVSSPLPCGGVYWGHDGGIIGFRTQTGVTTDGRTATVMNNLYPGGSDAQIADMRTALATALCESTPGKPKP